MFFIFYLKRYTFYIQLVKIIQKQTKFYAQQIIKNITGTIQIRVF